MSATAIVPQTPTLNTNNSQIPHTGIIGVMRGQYEAYVGGQFVTTLYSDTYQAALSDFHQLLDEYRSIPLFVDDEKVV